MPIIDASSYRPPLLLRGAHLETIAPNLTRRRIRVAYRRTRLELSDGDFIDLDLASSRGNGAADVCLVVLHGLEGSARAPYVKSFARSATRRGFDCVAVNMRGCGGELNRLPRFYHSGETGDLREALAYLSGRYAKLGLVGFSLGGNVVLKYLGEDPENVDRAVFAAVSYSAPIELAGSARRMGEASNAFYMRRFIRLLSDKIERKAQVYPEVIDASGSRSMRSFLEFDGRFTAPLSGFASAEDYWRRCSAVNWLSQVSCPALSLSARNDPFLSPGCFAEAAAERSAFVYALFPDNGGHIGFPGKRVRGESWHERAGLDFLESILEGRSPDAPGPR